MTARSAARWFLASLVIVIFPACAWYPYRWRSLRELNRAQRSASGALSLHQPGIALSDAPPEWLSGVRCAQRFELMIRARPSPGKRAGPARLFTFSQDEDERNLTIAQQGDSLRLRLRARRANSRGLPELVVPRVFRPGEWVTLQVSVGGGLLAVTVDGQQAARFAVPQAALASWDESYPVALGNDPNGERPWLGEITRAEVAIDERRVNLLLPPYLALPEKVRSYNTPPKLVPLRDLDLRDALVNLLGFIPLGWALNFAFARPLKLWTAALVGFSVSLVLETAQLWLPMRFPSVDDLVLNTLGCVLGLLFARVGLATIEASGLVKSQRR